MSEAAAAPAPAAAPVVPAPVTEAPTVQMPVPENQDLRDPSSEETTTAEAPLSLSSLYVGELDPSVTEAMLYELFLMCGPVASIRVCRDAVTRRSLGYAYVNFHYRQDAERAINELNYAEIKGKPCRIMWSQRDPSLRKNGSGNIFIKNLDSSIDNKALHDTFAAFGRILSCKVATDNDGRSRGYGYVHYEEEESARDAIEKVNGMLLNDQKVFVGPHIPRSERLSKLEEKLARFTNVFVKNIDTEVTLDQFRELFSKYGAITSAVIATDEEGNSKGFGFVNFEEHESAKRAVEELHDTEFHGKNLFVSRAQKKRERQAQLRLQYEQARAEKHSKYQGVNLFIKNFGDEIDDDNLRQEFSVFGIITSAKVMRDEKGRSKGFGFVCFSTPDEASRAINEMNGRMLGNKPIYVALHQRHDERRRTISQRKQGFMYPQMPNAFIPPGAAGYAIPPGYPPAPGQFPHPSMPRPMEWAINGQPGAIPPYPAAPSIHPQYQNTARPMAPRPPRSRNPNQRGGARGGGPRGISARGGHYPRNPRSVNQQFAAGAPASDDAAAAAAAAAASAQSEEEPVKLTAASLAAASEENQKQMLGEALYPKIQQLADEDSVAKITGMLLEMDNSELLDLLEDHSALQKKVSEATEILRSVDVPQTVEN